MARDVFHVVLAAVARMTTDVPFLHRERSVTPTGLRKGEHRKGRANHMVLVDVQRDGAHGALEPGQVSPPFPEHEPGEQAPERSRGIVTAGIEWNACRPAAIRHHEIRQAQARPAYGLACGAERDQRQYRQGGGDRYVVPAERVVLVHAREDLARQSRSARLRSDPLQCPRQRPVHHVGVGEV